VTIITACYNSALTIEKTINSIISQNYSEIEYIIIDGLSTDKTSQIISKYKSQISRIISEPDKGIYDALNKGLKVSSGDIIGFVHSDDILANNSVISDIVSMFKVNEFDIIWGDLIIENISSKKIKRFYSGGRIGRKSFNIGVMPPHPATFIRTTVYKKFGSFNTLYKISSDYDLLFRFIVLSKVSYGYINKVLVIMSDGGISNSSWFNKLLLNFEIIKIHKYHKKPIKLSNLIKKIPFRLKEISNL
jgi:glycosyltransferase involved in cell wall biosynthesis